MPVGRPGSGHEFQVTPAGWERSRFAAGARLSCQSWRLDDLLDVLDGYDVTLVDVRCSAGELDRRERARGDRPVGLAASQTQVFSHEDNDLVVDTTHRSAADCARDVVDRLDSIGGPKAFERLRVARMPAE